MSASESEIARLNQAPHVRAFTDAVAGGKPILLKLNLRLDRLATHPPKGIGKTKKADMVSLASTSEYMDVRRALFHHKNPGEIAGRVLVAHGLSVQTHDGFDLTGEGKLHAYFRSRVEPAPGYQRAPAKLLELIEELNQASPVETGKEPHFIAHHTVNSERNFEPRVYLRGGVFNTALQRVTSGAVTIQHNKYVTSYIHTRANMRQSQVGELRPVIKNLEGFGIGILEFDMAREIQLREEFQDATAAGKYKTMRHYIDWLVLSAKQLAERQPPENANSNQQLGQMEIGFSVSC